ncbi:MAG: hypothetical protein CMI18_04615 [Opitutaceae bacterium]|nr:hypothetical protein [Opitutaceae bacterium]
MRELDGLPIRFPMIHASSKLKLMINFHPSTNTLSQFSGLRLRMRCRLLWKELNKGADREGNNRTAIRSIARKHYRKYLKKA